MSYYNNSNLIKTAQNSLYNRYNNIEKIEDPLSKTQTVDNYQKNPQNQNSNSDKIAAEYLKRLGGGRMESSSSNNQFNYSQAQNNLRYESMVNQSNHNQNYGNYEQDNKKMTKTVRFKDLEDQRDNENFGDENNYENQYRQFMEENLQGNPQFNRDPLQFEKDEKLVSFSTPYAPELEKLHKQHLELLKPTQSRKKGGSNKSNITSENNPILNKGIEDIPKFQPQQRNDNQKAKIGNIREERFSREPPKYSGSGGVLPTNDTSVGNPLNPHNPEMLAYYKRINEQRVAQDPFKRHGRRRNMGYGGGGYGGYGGGMGGGGGGGGGMRRGGGGIAFNL